MRAIDHDAADLANTGGVVARNESDRCYLNEWPAYPGHSPRDSLRTPQDQAGSDIKFRVLRRARLAHTVGKSHRLRVGG